MSPIMLRGSAWARLHGEPIPGPPGPAPAPLGGGRHAATRGRAAGDDAAQFPGLGRVLRHLLCYWGCILTNSELSSTSCYSFLSTGAPQRPLRAAKTHGVCGTLEERSAASERGLARYNSLTWQPRSAISQPFFSSHKILPKARTGCFQSNATFMRQRSGQRRGRGLAHRFQDQNPGVKYSWGSPPLCPRALRSYTFLGKT